jgi:hypothetical protein
MLPRVTGCGNDFATTELALQQPPQSHIKATTKPVERAE